MGCYNCVKKDYCTLIHHFNHDLNVGCIEFQDRDYTTYVSGTLNIEDKTASKELTPLEVSNQLKEFVLEFVKNGLDKMFINGSFDIIESTLKDYEYQTRVLKKLTEPKLLSLSEKEIQQFKNSSAYITEYEGVYVDENISKKLKALKIIKEKEVDVGLLIRCLNSYCIDSACQEYNQWTQTKHLTHEECVLLKEVLL